MGNYLRWQELRTLNEIKGIELLNKSTKSNRRPPLSQIHEDKRKVCPGDILKTDFSKVVFTEDGKVMFNGSDGWSKGWVLQDRETQVIKKR